MKESCRTYEWVVSHVGTSHVTLMTAVDASKRCSRKAKSFDKRQVFWQKTSLLTKDTSFDKRQVFWQKTCLLTKDTSFGNLSWQRVMSHIWLQSTHQTASCECSQHVSRQRVMSYIFTTSHVKSFHTHGSRKCDCANVQCKSDVHSSSRTLVQLHACYWVTRLIRMCDMTPSYVWHDSFICVIWLACVTCMESGNMKLQVLRVCVFDNDISSNVKVMYIRAVAHDCSRLQSCMAASVPTSHTYTYRLADSSHVVEGGGHTCARHVRTCVCVTWRTRVCVMYDCINAHWCMTGSGHVAHMNESCHTYEWVMSHVGTSHVTHIWRHWCSHTWSTHVDGCASCMTASVPTDAWQHQGLHPSVTPPLHHPPAQSCV